MDTKIALHPDPARGPRYRALADAICDGVASGAIAAGERLPPVRELSFRLKISPGAVARAYRLATERGALEAAVGRGTFARAAYAAGRAPAFQLQALLEAGPPETLDLRGNQAVDVGQDAEIGAALARLMARHHGRPPLTGYRRREDDPEAIETLAGWLRAGGVPAEAERTLVVSGAQAGVVACLAALARGGEGVVLVETTLHPGLRDGAATLGLRLEPVACDAEGMRPDALDAACARLRPDAAQLSPTLQNPTLATMGEARRREIVAVARRRNLMLVEDDVYGRLIHPAPTPLAALAPERTWHVTSLSKCVAAGLRAGLVLTPPGRLTATFRAYQALAHQTPWLVKALAAELVAGGEAERILARVTEETAARAALAARLLGPFGARTHPAASFAHCPLEAPWSAGEFISAAAAAGVLLPPPSIYQVGRTPDFVRIALGARLSRDALEQALTRLASLLREGPHLCCAAT
jgi:DNA-binding transcriptional MocR family regulator